MSPTWRCSVLSLQALPHRFVLILTLYSVSLELTTMSNDTKADPPATHDEKSAIDTMEQGTMPATYPGAAAASWDPEYRARVEKKMKRKLDARCSLFIVIYIMNYLDRNNIGAARLKGLERDLGLEGKPGQYQTCLSILYVGYILMQVPSNIFINKISRPSKYISAVMLLWGMISTLSGVTHNFSGMVAIRFFLGFVEAAFLPGALMILSKWYTRKELTTRNALLFCGNLISNAFSSLVGAGGKSKQELKYDRTSELIQFSAIQHGRYARPCRLEMAFLE